MLASDPSAAPAEEWTALLEASVARSDPSVWFNAANRAPILERAHHVELVEVVVVDLQGSWFHGVFLETHPLVETDRTYIAISTPLCRNLAAS